MKSVFLLVILPLFLAGCSSQYANKELVGQQLPSIQGESISSEEINIPEAFAGKQTLLLFAYKHEAQFDVDRWLIGLDMTQTQIDIYEIPHSARHVFPYVQHLY
jgi:hypothetical protein